MISKVGFSTVKDRVRKVAIAGVAAALMLTVVAVASTGATTVDDVSASFAGTVQAAGAAQGAEGAGEAATADNGIDDMDGNDLSFTPDSAGEPLADRTPATFALGAIRRTAVLADLNIDSAPSANQSANRVAVTQDLVGMSLSASIRFRANPTAALNSAVLVAVGTWGGSTCYTRMLIAGNTASAGSQGGFVDSNGDADGTLPVSRSLSGNTLTLRSGKHSRVRAGNWDCAFAVVVQSLANSGNTYQSFFAENLATSYKPKVRMKVGPPVQGEYKGKWTTVRLEIENTTRGIARNVRVKGKGKNLKFKPSTLKVGNLGARSTKYRKLKVRLKGKKARKAKFQVKVGGGKNIQRSVKIVRKPRPKKLRSLVGEYFWGFKWPSYYKGWDNKAVMFVDRKWAYVGFPPRGKPKCKKRMKDCRRYKYNRGSGKVRIGKWRGRVNSEGMNIREKKKTWQRYYRLHVPKPKTKIKTALYRRDFSGCMGVGYCSTWMQSLTMTKKGKFKLVQSSLSSLGIPGGPQTWVVGARPDERGTYKILSRGRIRLKFANGKKRVATIGFERDASGKPSPRGAGLLLGDENFYGDF